MLPARIIENEPLTQAFQPRVIDGTLAALDLEALMSAAAVFEGYDAAAVIDDSGTSPSIWDDALDIRVSCL